MGDATKHTDFVMMNQYFGTWHGPKGSLGTALDTIHNTWPDKMVIVSEFGFAPHWQRIEGPRVIDPIQYYHNPEDIGADSPEADIQRQYVINDQMAGLQIVTSEKDVEVQTCINPAGKVILMVINHAAAERKFTLP